MPLGPSLSDLHYHTAFYLLGNTLIKNSVMIAYATDSLRLAQIGLSRLMHSTPSPHLVPASMMSHCDFSDDYLIACFLTLGAMPLLFARHAFSLSHWPAAFHHFWFPLLHRLCSLEGRRLLLWLSQASPRAEILRHFRPPLISTAC